MRFPTVHSLAATAVLVCASHSIARVSESGVMPGLTEKRQYTIQLDQQQFSDLEAKVIDAFNHRQCEAILSLVPRGQFLPPTGLAILAYCEPDPLESNRLFQVAEQEAPSSDVVVMLHARRLARNKPLAAEPFWRRALLLARSSYVRLMANAFLEGRGDVNEPIEIETPLLIFGSLRLSGGEETNPQFLLLGGQTSPSAFLNAQLIAGLLHTLSIGALAANYTMNRYQYFSRPAANLWKHDLEAPLILRAGTNEDIRVIPFGDYWYLNVKPYYEDFGLRVAGIAFRGNYKQTVQASLFHDHYDNALTNHQAGSHFRFNYLWEFYPLDWYLNFNAYIEHVQAGRDRNARGAPTFNIPYSHNDISFNSVLEYHLRAFFIGLNAGFILREDDLDSDYVVGPAGTPDTIKRRQDLFFYLEPNVTVPLSSSLQVVASYRVQRNFSNMGPSDYQDQSYVNDVVSLGIRVFMESL